ncbi:MAG: hypothetical protein H0T66_15690 [Geodermatophilaceae bacterium]|nr:hypothetical protein [Geodermatophilaceae bacterium]
MFVDAQSEAEGGAPRSVNDGAVPAADALASELVERSAASVCDHSKQCLSPAAWWVQLLVPVAPQPRHRSPPSSARDRWSRANYGPDHEADRTSACLICIGLEHLICNAIIGRWDDLDDVVDRMTALDLI